jgi:DNA-directed RNA polymerase specialized sigma24 family protein
LRAAIKRLPDRERAILDALNFAASSYAHISRSLDIPLGSIGPTRDRALARLRRDGRLAALAQRRLGARADACSGDGRGEVSLLFDCR